MRSESSGAMANIRCALLGMLLLSVLSVAQSTMLFYGKDAQIGSVQFYNYDAGIWIRSTTGWADGTKVTSPSDTYIAPLVPFVYPITEGIIRVDSLLKKQNITGSYDQLILSWDTQPGLALPCSPNCYYYVDDGGISVTTASGSQSFIAGWRGPL